MSSLRHLLFSSVILSVLISSSKSAPYPIWSNEPNLHQIWAEKCAWDCALRLKGKLDKFTPIFKEDTFEAQYDIDKNTCINFEFGKDCMIGCPSSRIKDMFNLEKIYFAKCR